MVDNPQRAVSADPGEVESRGGLAFRDVSRAVGANEDKGHPASAGALQGGQPVADGFEAHLEPSGQLVDVIADALSSIQESQVGQQQRAGEIVGQTDAGYAARIV